MAPDARTALNKLHLKMSENSAGGQISGASPDGQICKVQPTPYVYTQITRRQSDIRRDLAHQARHGDVWFLLLGNTPHTVIQSTCTAVAGCGRALRYHELAAAWAAGDACEGAAVWLGT